ncbi:MAG: DNA-methyltransferase [Spirochaetota bacterium]
MFDTIHSLYFYDSSNLSIIPSETIDLIVTSPPYPMIEMWDGFFKGRSENLRDALEGGRGEEAFELMHLELDRVWSELHRVLKSGGFLCINIGDAVRSTGGHFQLYSNHARVIQSCTALSFHSLPLILWRKQTNAPNKFMGSGMLPAGAYVTLEHEYILVFRKHGKREFSGEDRIRRRQSAYFWEERNNWFSDIWDFKGTRQDLEHEDLRKRSASFPFELAYRLINMYSLIGDRVLDPFLGIGTTILAAMASCRNSIGVEIEPGFKGLIRENVREAKDFLNDFIAARLENHLKFVESFKASGKTMKYRSKNYNFPVMTSQEEELLLPYVVRIETLDDCTYKVYYSENPSIYPPGGQYSFL